MIELQEAERMLDRLIDDASDGSYSPDYSAGASHLLTRLTSAGAFRKLDATEVTTAILNEGVTLSAAAYTVRVLRKLGVVA